MTPQAPKLPHRSVSWMLATLALSASLALAQGTTTPTATAPKDTTHVATPAPATRPAAATTPAPATPPSPLSGIRNKLAAGDLLSAESILEVHRAKNGEDGPWLVGLSWLARGALLMDDARKADQYAAAVRARCADSVAHGVDLAKSHDVETALGAAIEVAAQRLERTRGRRSAAALVRAELAQWKGPVALRARLHKRLNMLTLVGSPAPEIAAEDFVGNPPPTLASLRGKPVLLFVWAEYCGDCRAQEATLAKIQARYAPKGLQVIALTRYYETDAADRPREKARVDSVWKADYKEMVGTPIVMSTASDEWYGGSSTPTFVFIDRAGIVRRYEPTRLTETEFDRTLTELVRPMGRPIE
jgi:cytochrome c biogenesis protein CcmG/thiol:disulfide interchange protein DsbE